MDDTSIVGIYIIFVVLLLSTTKSKQFRFDFAVKRCTLRCKISFDSRFDSSEMEYFCGKMFRFSFSMSDEIYLNERELNQCATERNKTSYLFKLDSISVVD